MLTAFREHNLYKKDKHPHLHQEQDRFRQTSAAITPDARKGQIYQRHEVEPGGKPFLKTGIEEIKQAAKLDQIRHHAHLKPKRADHPQVERIKKGPERLVSRIEKVPCVGQIAIRIVRHLDGLAPKKDQPAARQDHQQYQRDGFLH